MKRYIHRRNIRFKNFVENADKSKLIGVAIDPSSNFHRVIIFNFLGEIIGKPFSIDILRTGYDLLIMNINKAKKKTKFTEIYIAIESAGSYSENLYIHLYEEFKNTVLIPPKAVSDNRKQKSLHGLKSDDIDCGAIGDLLIRGEFTKSAPDSLLYYKLRNLVYWREKKISMMVKLKNQILDRLKRCYPGLNCEFEQNKRIYSNPDKSFIHQGLLNNRMTGQEILKTSDIELFDKFNYSTKYHGREKNIGSIRKRLNNMLLPTESFARVHLDILSLDIKLLRLIQDELNRVEEEIIELGKKTPAIYLMGQIKGLSDFHVLMYVGLIGDIRRYKSAANIYSMSGMSPKIQQSGAASMSRSFGIKRAGNVMLRSLLFNLAIFAIKHEPFFSSYYQRIKIEKNRNWKKNVIVISHKLNNTLFALMRDKSQFKWKAPESSNFIIGSKPAKLIELL